MKIKFETEERLGPARTGLWAQLTEVSSPMRWADILVLALIFGFGAWQFFSVERAPDFTQDDVFFSDAAHSLIHHGFYGINGNPETNMPPGLSWIFAALSLAGAGSHTFLLRAMVVFGTLGFMGSYELLRRQAPRVVAAAICLLLISSRVQFGLATQLVWPCYPYFFAATSALLVARQLERATSRASRIAWGALLTVFILASQMFASAGIAFLGAIVASIGVIYLQDRYLGFARLKTYLAVFLIGVAVQGVWMHQRIEASAGISAQEWPVAGFPHSYVAQLKLKEGRYPELGNATLSDLPVRVLKNAYEHANLLSQMLLQRWIYLAWMSIATIGMLILIAIGWCSTMWPKGGSLQDWYFAGYEFIYLLWPWELEPRFFLPVAPLACLYAWRGVKTIGLLANSKPRVVGLVWVPVAILLSVNSWFWIHGIGRAGSLPHAGLQDETSFAVWSLSAILAAWMVWADTAWLTPGYSIYRRYSQLASTLRLSPLRLSQLFGMVVVAGLVIKGLDTQIKVGRANMDLKSSTNRLPADAEAGEWVGEHTDPNAIVMARHVPTVYHYSKRNVIWFPPSSNPQLLMEGILRQRVNFVLVVNRKYNYYLPPDEECFAPLLKAYPDAFSPVYQARDFSVFQVIGRPPSKGYGIVDVAH
jgi:hypothetical protein